MRLSIVTTMYCSAPYIEEFYERIRAEAEKLTDSYEIIFVNDGSPDNSLEIAIGLYEKDPKVRIIDLSRNFGHHKAIMTGLVHARGELVMLLDIDLEEEPEFLSRFYEKLEVTGGADVIYGVQDTRKGGMFERVSGTLFYALLNALSSYPIPQNLITARIMTRRYVQALIKHQDREVFIDGLWAITGFNQIPLKVRKLSKSSSTYSFQKKMGLFVNAITSFSYKPLVWIFYLGTFMLFVSGAGILWLVTKKLLYNFILPGWTSVLVSIWFVGGIILFCQGVIGFYLSKIFIETKRRPYTIIRDIYERPFKSDSLE